MSLLSCFNRRRVFARAVALLVLCLSLPVAGVADPVPCASLGFDPSEEGEGILERFFVETDGVGGLGCWMHPHANGKDAIFTPYSWGRNPNLGKQGVLDVRRIEPRRLVLVDLLLPQGYSLEIHAPADVNNAFHATLHFERRVFQRSSD